MLQFNETRCGTKPLLTLRVAGDLDEGKRMNWFVLAGGALWLGAAVQWAMDGNYRMAWVAVCYAASQFALMGAR